MIFWTTARRKFLDYVSNKGKVSVFGDIEKFTSDNSALRLSVLEASEIPTTANATHTCTVALIPANSLVIGVATRVGALGVLTGADTWSIGVSGATTRYGTTIARTAATTTTFANHLVTAYPTYYATSTALVLTSSSSNWSTGAQGPIKVKIYYFTLTAPTS